MSELLELAYVPSASEYDKYFKKFRAFMPADVSAVAKEQGAWVSDNYKGKGYFPMRSPLPGSSDGVSYGYDDGVHAWSSSYNNDAGLRVALNLIYNPDSSLVKGCKYLKQTSLVCDKETDEDIKVTSTAPIITVDGTQFIWLNKEECEAGTAKIMELWSLELVERAEAFDEAGDHNDYAKAEKLRAQCNRFVEDLAQKNAEFKELLVPVKMSSEDDYETAIPQLPKAKEMQVQKDKELQDNGVKSLFEKLLNNTIDEDGLRDALKEICEQKRALDSSTKEDAIRLGEEIFKCAEWYEKELENKNSKDKAFNDTISAIDNLTLGGK